LEQQKISGRAGSAVLHSSGGSAKIARQAAVFASVFLPLLGLFPSCSASREEIPPRTSAAVGRIAWAQWPAAAGWEARTGGGSYDTAELARLRRWTEERDAFFTVFATTDCPECREYLPSLFRIFEEAGIDSSRIALYGLDETMSEPSGYHRNFAIPAVPCVFVSRAGAAAGVIAYPHFDWLEGLLDLLSK